MPSTVIAPPFYSVAVTPRDPIDAQRQGIRLPDLIMSDDWLRYFNEQQRVIEKATQAVALGPQVNLASQGASIGTTAIPLGTLSAGLYRVSYYFRITRAATASSSLQLTIGWTETVSLTISGTAETGNTVTTVQVGTLPLVVDASSAITYATSYSSTGATSMLYRLRIDVERVTLDSV